MTIEKPTTITLYAADGHTIDGKPLIVLNAGEPLDGFEPDEDNVEGKPINWIALRKTPSGESLQSDGPSASASAT